jgi:predicted transcriptional regulator of viral defense system
MDKLSNNLSRWVDDQQAQGRYDFSRTTAQAALAMSAGTLTKALQRLSASRRICHVCRGFYTIVPLEHRTVGNIPAEWYVNNLMRERRQPFYVGLLSAAAWHGAGHQQPQELQVVTDMPSGGVETPRGRIAFFVFRQLSAALTEMRRTQTGDVPVSTPAWTALDLLRFQRRLGGLDGVAPVLAELAESMQPEGLLAACAAEPERSQIRRLGWLLEYLGHDDLARPLATTLSKNDPLKVLLDPAAPPRGRLHPLWRVVENMEPEFDA